MEFQNLTGQVVFLAKSIPVDYEIVGVFSTGENAIAAIQKRFPAPYIVKWSVELCPGDDVFVLRGDFAEVVHYAIEHTAEWEICACEIDGWCSA